MIWLLSSQSSLGGIADTRMPAKFFIMRNFPISMDSIFYVYMCKSLDSISFISIWSYFHLSMSWWQIQNFCEFGAKGISFLGWMNEIKYCYFLQSNLLPSSLIGHYWIDSVISRCILGMSKQKQSIFNLHQIKLFINYHHFLSPWIVSLSYSGPNIVQAIDSSLLVNF